MSRRAYVRFFAAAWLSALVGCLSPTLPLPPPEEPSAITPESATGDVWIISGSCLQGALVTVFNETTGVGAVVEDRDRDGQYEVRLEASLCDVAWVDEALGEERSGRTTFVVQDRTPSGVVDPSLCK
jgi:hypothetical protein